MTRIQIYSLVFAYLGAVVSWGGFARHRLPAPMDLAVSPKGGEIVALAHTQPPEERIAKAPVASSSPTVPSAPVATDPSSRVKPPPRVVRLAFSHPEFNAVPDHPSVVPARDHLAVTLDALDRRRLPPGGLSPLR